LTKSYKELANNTEMCLFYTFPMACLRENDYD